MLFVQLTKNVKKKLRNFEEEKIMDKSWTKLRNNENMQN